MEYEELVKLISSLKTGIKELHTEIGRLGAEVFITRELAQTVAEKLATAAKLVGLCTSRECIAKVLKELREEVETVLKKLNS